MLRCERSEPRSTHERFPPPSRSDGGGEPPKAVEGAGPRTALGIAPSTMLRMVPLPRFAEEERFSPLRALRLACGERLGMSVVV